MSDKPTPMTETRTFWALLSSLFLVLGGVAAFQDRRTWGVWMGAAMATSLLGNFYRNRKTTRELDLLVLREGCTIAFGALFVGSLFYAQVGYGMDVPPLDPTVIFLAVSLSGLSGYLISYARHR